MAITGANSDALLLASTMAFVSCMPRNAADPITVKSPLMVIKIPSIFDVLFLEITYAIIGNATEGIPNATPLIL